MNDCRKSTGLERFNSDSGSILILLAILVPALFLVMSLALNSTYATMIRGELQTASDASALAGSFSLNGSPEGWDRARSYAILVLNKQGVHGSPGSAVPIPGNLTISASDTTAAGVEKTVWQVPELRVSVKRGRWVRRSGVERFESMEDEDDADGDWQAANPGLPRIALANAVQVSVERSSVSVLLPTIGTPSSYEIGRAAVATTGAIGKYNIAPFAMPLCSIITGEFMGSTNVPRLMPSGSADIPDTMCGADRIFAKASRYGTDVGEEIVPDFNYRPAVAPEPARPQCSWGNFRFTDSRDHFGVVGLASGSAVTEDDIRNVLLTGNGLQHDVRIGDQFSILADGLEDADTDTALADRILKDTPDTEGDDFVSGISTSFSDTIGLGAHSALEAITWIHPGTFFDPACQDVPFATHGLCNSKQMTYENRSGTCGTDFVYPCPTGNCEYDGTVWRVYVAVIADSSGAAGCSIDTSTHDYELDPTHSYEVVGFVRASIYDVDIGAPPPTAPACPGGASDPATHPGMPWGFVGGNCNAVRAQLDCNTEFIAPPMTDEQLGNPVLVEAHA